MKTQKQRKSKISVDLKTKFSNNQRFFVSQKSMISVKIMLFGMIMMVLMLSTAGNAGVISNLAGLPLDTHYLMRVTMINQMPDPAEPGKYVDVRFKFENNGTKTAENVEAEILPQYPFSLDPGTDAIKRLGSINAQQKGDKGVVIKYRLRVDKDALEGESEIKLRYRTSENVWITMPEFRITIQPYDVNLLLDKVASSPKAIKPGEKAKISITFRNTAEILLKKIRVKMDLENAPLAPIESTNEKVIEMIDKGKSAELAFDIIGEPDAAAGIYKVPVEFVYYDSLGNSYNRNSTIGLIVGSEPDLAVNVDSTTIYQARKPGNVIIKIVNKDVNEIKFLNAKLEESSDYTIISPSEAYVGNIDSDDYETAEFTLFVKNKKDRKISLPLHLEYRDPNNILYAENIKLELQLYSTSEAKQLGLIKGNGKMGFFVIILVIAGGLFMYRRWKKSKRKEK